MGEEKAGGGIIGDAVCLRDALALVLGTLAYVTGTESGTGKEREKRGGGNEQSWILHSRICLATSGQMAACTSLYWATHSGLSLMTCANRRPGCVALVRVQSWVMMRWSDEGDAGRRIMRGEGIKERSVSETDFSLCRECPSSITRGAQCSWLRFLPGGGKLEAQLFGKPRQRPGRGPVEPAPTPQWKLERDHPLPAPGMRGIQVTPRLSPVAVAKSVLQTGPCGEWNLGRWLVSNVKKTLVEIDTGADGHDICRYMKRTLQTSLGFLIYDAFFLRPGGGGGIDAG